MLLKVQCKGFIRMPVFFDCCMVLPARCSPTMVVRPGLGSISPAVCKTFCYSHTSHAATVITLWLVARPVSLSAGPEAFWCSPGTLDVTEGSMA